jgi:acyl-CoA synthetase (AMP-forming)/AMP-acid ligase II
VDADGWYRTKDYCRIDADGYIYIVGRASDMIIRGGANVSPAEVERVLCAHPAVAEAAVVGAPDPVYGERVVAFVVPVPGAEVDVELLGEYCGERLASYKVPRDIRLVDRLARTATGKVARKRLLAEAGANV